MSSLVRVCVSFMALSPLASNDRNTIDHDVERARKRRHAQEDPRRRLHGEVTRVDLVEGRELRRVGAVDVALHHALQGRASGLQAALHLLEHDLGLAREGLTADLAGVGVEGRKARHENEAARDDDRKDRPLASPLQVRRERLDPDRCPLHAALLCWCPNDALGLASFANRYTARPPACASAIAPNAQRYAISGALVPSAGNAPTIVPVTTARMLSPAICAMFTVVTPRPMS